jgi:competence protein ComFA
VATPRRDVVLELSPRIRKAFPLYRVKALYGGSEEAWQSGEITIATTHQLLRMQAMFDLVVIDELDAFPYHNNPQLYYAAQKVCKQGGAMVYLSATPPPQMIADCARGTLAHVMLPVRYHRHPLPVPRVLHVLAPRQLGARGRVPALLLRGLRNSLARGAQVFVFVPRIKDIAPLLQVLRRALPDVALDGSSSVDVERAEKVQNFRDSKLRLLVTTAILERGVTIPHSDIFILGADERVYTETALVQMAGRAGRSGDDPHGVVYFCAPEVSLGMKQAIKRIKRMNHLARKQGYLIS